MHVLRGKGSVLCTQDGMEIVLSLKRVFPALETKNARTPDSLRGAEG